MARLINDTGILGDTMVTVSTMTTQGNFDEVVSFDTIVEAIHRVQENMKITGTTAVEASGTIEGSVNSMKAAWSNWQAGLADPDADMATLTDNLVGSFQTAADNVIPAVQRIGDSVAGVFTYLTGIDLSPVTSVFDSLKTSLSDIGSAFAEGGLSGGFEEIVSQIEQLTGLDLSGVTGTLSGIGKAFANIGEAFADGGLSGGLTETLDALKDATGIDLSGFVEGVRGFFAAFFGADSAAFTSIGEAIGAIINAFDKETVAAIITEIANAIGGFIERVGEIADSSISFIAEIVEQLAKDFGDLLPGIVGCATAIGTFIVVVKGMEIINSIPVLLASAGTAITAFKTMFAGLNAVMAANPVGLVISLLAGLAAAFATAMATNEDFRNSVVNALEAIRTGFSNGIAFIKSVLSELPAVASGLFSGFMDEFRKIPDGIAEMVGTFRELGANLVQGLVNGLTEKLSAAKEAIIDMSQKVVNWVKNAFDIHSPSRVFYKIGEYLMQGMALGIDDEISVVQGSIDKMRFTVPSIRMGNVTPAQSTMGKMSEASINSAIAMANGSGGTSTINLVVDGRTLAQVVFDPLNGLIKQKGVTLGA